MNIKVLKQAEKSFLASYPGGFTHPKLLELGKKHKMEQLEKYARKVFVKKNFNEPCYIVDEMAKLIAKSTMVSIFEKPKFRDFSKSLTLTEKEELSEALYQLLHGKEKEGFVNLVDFLKPSKLAKWTLVTTVPAYYRPQKEVFVKPTTAKLIIDRIELDLKYSAIPNWDFYRKFRACVNELKNKTNKNLAPNNPAYCGFLMMSL